MKFNENPSNGSRVFPLDGQTGRHDGANSRFSQYDDSAKNIGHLDSNVLCFEKNDVWTVLTVSSFTYNRGSSFPAVSFVADGITGVYHCERDVTSLTAEINRRSLH
jgi:hypothetical protein